ncbi:Meiotically up-regulated gene 65 protein [Wickerhamiella sorbophila]|uniref:peptidylprolyl isomerase n=1 Tax=Wickerhamiella sorbophila TaxID=45607 RepID=A0A2T0FFR3_9ASCO|nr:Meiotically up-regulated gene 65 protein [Wickerhamiella sorbophila]PRT53825.1 Meiotically up-regulated gene 65 protein [Wickerhamiella sorbophila]
MGDPGDGGHSIWKTPFKVETNGLEHEKYTLGSYPSGPESNGSQFIITTGDIKLDKKSTVFGKVTSGFDVVDALNNLPTKNGVPLHAAVIHSASTSYCIMSVPHVELETGEHEAWDYQIESQRGWVLLGYPFFSSKLLLAMDPREYSARDGSALGNHLCNVNLPDDTWEWVWPRWYVDMANDVDDQGWLYSWRFRSKDWKGYPRIGRSFVRQRQWKRLRRKKAEYRFGDKNAMSNDQVCQDLLSKVTDCKDERSKVTTVIRYINRYPERAEALRQSGKLLSGMFLLPISEHEIMRRLSEVPIQVKNSISPF